MFQEKNCRSKDSKGSSDDQECIIQHYSLSQNFYVRIPGLIYFRMASKYIQYIYKLINIIGFFWIG